MTATSLFTAVAVGMVIGFTGHWIGRSTRRVPPWLPPAVGVGAALLGTIAARFAGVDTPRVSLVEIVLQVALATITVAVVLGTTDRQRTHGRSDRTAETR